MKKTEKLLFMSHVFINSKETLRQRGTETWRRQIKQSEQTAVLGCLGVWRMECERIGKEEKLEEFNKIKRTFL